MKTAPPTPSDHTSARCPAARLSDVPFCLGHFGYFVEVLYLDVTFVFCHPVRDTLQETPLRERQRGERSRLCDIPVCQEHLRRYMKHYKGTRDCPGCDSMDALYPADKRLYDVVYDQEDPVQKVRAVCAPSIEEVVIEEGDANSMDSPSPTKKRNGIPSERTHKTTKADLRDVTDTVGVRRNIFSGCIL